MANARGKLEFSSAIQFLTRSRRNGGPMRILVAKSLTKQALRWFDKTLRKHFDPIAPAIYPGVYTPLSPSYLKRKDKAGKGPMVFSGAMRRQILGSRPVITGKSNSATVKLKLPQSRITNIHKRGSRHDFPAQLTAFNARDRKSLVRGVSIDLRKRVRAELKKRGPKTVKRFVA